MASRERVRVPCLTRPQAFVRDEEQAAGFPPLPLRPSREFFSARADARRARFGVCERVRAGGPQIHPVGTGVRAEGPLIQPTLMHRPQATRSASQGRFSDCSFALNAVIKDSCQRRPRARRLSRPVTDPTSTRPPGPPLLGSVRRGSIPRACARACEPCLRRPQVYVLQPPCFHHGSF